MSVFTWSLKRLIGALIAVFLSSVLVFIIFFVLPGGDPAVRLAGQAATPETIQSLRSSYGFDQPIYIQYFAMMQKLFTNQLISYGNHTPVLSQLVFRLGPTASLATGAIAIGGALAIIFGMVGAIFQGKAPAALVSVVTIVFISAPPAFLAIALQQGLAQQLGLFPVGGYVSITTDPVSWAIHLALPCIVLSLPILAVSGKLFRSSLLEAKNHPYVKTARAKGAGTLRIWCGHIMPNAILTVVTTLGLELGVLLGGGTILVETIFNIHGIGQYAAQAVSTLDLPVLIGVTIAGTFIVIAVNLFVDILTTALDPRTRDSI